MLDLKQWRFWPIQAAWIILVVIIFLTEADCRSPHPAPLRKITTTTSHLAILPRRANSGINPRYITALPPPPSTLKHSDSIVLSLDLPELLPFELKLLVKPSKHIFHPDAQSVYYNGQKGMTERLREEDWRLYTGEVVHPSYIDRFAALHVAEAHQPVSERSHILGSASVMVHDPGNLYGQGAIWEGSFSVNGELYNVMTKDNYQRVKTKKDIDVESAGQMVVFRQSDASHEAETTAVPLCSHDSLEYNGLSNPIHNTSSASDSSSYPFLDTLNPLWKKSDIGGESTNSSNFINSINNTDGCPNTQQIVYMGVALDCNYVAAYGSAERARIQTLNNWNQISSLYQSTFNISLGLIEIQVQDMACPETAVEGEEWNVGCDHNISLNQRLNEFSGWRGQRGDDGAGLWHLMTACPTESEVGVAWLGTLCRTDSTAQAGDTVSGTGVSTATKTEWSLIAHEIGHGFGAIHDCTSGCSLSGPCCPFTTTTCNANGRHIMNPTTSSTEHFFSGCTVGNVCNNVGNRRISTSCIQTPGVRTVISLQQCGNGIVEDGEDCDPGANTTSPCCDASTCKFLSGAVCDPSSSVCCTASCQYASANTICRAAVHGICDYPEYCDGLSPHCPEDRTASDGTSCGNDGLRCANGTCTSLDRQCSMAGQSMGLSEACGKKNDRSCMVNCRDPTSINNCVELKTALVDGSPCGYAGHCYNATCHSGPWQDTAASWYRQNLRISIPVTVVVAIVVLAILFTIIGYICHSCIRRRRASQIIQFPSTGDSPIPTPSSARKMSPSVSQVRHSPILWGSSGSESLGETSAAEFGRRDSDYESTEMEQPPLTQVDPYTPSLPREYDSNNYEAQSVSPDRGGVGLHGWVDDKQWNGRDYGRTETYGRF
ncbi:zinc metalloprotease [Cryptococcus neoformans C23]|uniref:Disintegrin and metalloproteinase domain-containing protein B n=1 Tax=Cryptococcus neoformans (strain H99 / ATCC 208821 / CBS 10515 / FGSC 9487) TaxID=235443 RepID=J9VV77_CRYN9|nr:zinc metalloprotease [Cryptococcus neoformans var. grubii H99]AUB28270.1 zinc metalloprotease [Cryptococcus neoformans var. grubii]OWZ39519.1 zinc metalloprotease [Cryptococcus neoformans var. grubii C23]OXC81704.1 zinc metalloprotease [Cryptococcus neoformans var. grubii AD1-7a]AFR98163.2 zinc metalloprotease [Cryptococcus neoformans var. grubii H99]OXH24079.1 zinc metalloprotease [Cryptococcus neoformans var. grubii]|eukprot:XP_012052518.1 zinc metalloprotease [Cryptococcus neoformans var. grubii H99]